jgi:hypothetical protein
MPVQGAVEAGKGKTWNHKTPEVKPQKMRGI